MTSVQSLKQTEGHQGQLPEGEASLVIMEYSPRGSYWRDKA